MNMQIILNSETLGLKYCLIGVGKERFVAAFKNFNL